MLNLAQPKGWALNILLDQSLDDTILLVAMLAAHKGFLSAVPRRPPLTCCLCLMDSSTGPRDRMPAS